MTWHNKSHATGGEDVLLPSDIGAAASADQAFVRKTIDEAVTSSSAFQNDDELLLPVLANSVYLWRCVLIYDGATTGDIKLTFAALAGSSLSGGFVGLGTASASGTGSAGQVALITPGSGGSLGAAGAGTKVYAQGSGMFTTGGTAGNFQLQWAQSASDGTATTVYAGSHLFAQRVA